MAIEARSAAANNVDWIASARSYPERRLDIKTILGPRRVEYADRCSFDTRYISSAPRHRTPARAARARREHALAARCRIRGRSVATGPATAPRTWPSSAASRSASCAPARKRQRQDTTKNRHGARRPATNPSVEMSVNLIPAVPSVFALIADFTRSPKCLAACGRGFRPAPACRGPRAARRSCRGSRSPPKIPGPWPIG